ITPSWTPIHYVTKGEEGVTFNADAVRVKSARQAVYKDKRARKGGKLPDDVWVPNPSQAPELFTPDADLCLHSRVCGKFKERVRPRAATSSTRPSRPLLT